MFKTQTSLLFWWFLNLISFLSFIKTCSKTRQLHHLHFLRKVYLGVFFRSNALEAFRQIWLMNDNKSRGKSDKNLQQNWKQSFHRKTCHSMSRLRWQWFVIIICFIAGCACRFLYGPETKDEHKGQIEKSLDGKLELKLEVIFYKKNGKQYSNFFFSNM